MHQFKKLLLCIFLAIMLTGCQSTESKTPIQSDNVTPPQEQTNKDTTNGDIANNSFDPLQTKEGDRVAGLTVKSISYEKDYPNKDYPAEVDFTGELQITGNLVYHDETDEFFPDFLTFEVSEESKKNIPRLAYDERTYWFAFSDQAKAAQMLGKKSVQDLTIVVKDYKVWYAHTEVCDLADLVEVKYKE